MTASALPDRELRNLRRLENPICEAHGAALALEAIFRKDICESEPTTRDGLRLAGEVGYRTFVLTEDQFTALSHMIYDNTGRARDVHQQFYAAGEAEEADPDLSHTIPAMPNRDGKDRDLDELVSKISQEFEDRKAVKRERFDALYAEWLANRADGLRLDFDDEAGRKHSEREAELARLVTTTPAVLPWQVFFKLEVLEHYMEDSSNWTDNREMIMLAGIKADLRRFQISDGDD